VAIITLVTILLALPLAAIVLYARTGMALLYALGFLGVYAPLMLFVQWLVIGRGGAPLLAIDGSFLSLYFASLVWIRAIGYVWGEAASQES
jgi:hypothetical protein